jgi:plastocyanin
MYQPTFIARAEPVAARKANRQFPVAGKRTIQILLLMLAAADARATSWFVEVGGTQPTFSPADLSIGAGDSVTFTNLGGLHNVVADDGSFRCAHGCDGDGSGGDGNPSNSIWLATVSFPSPGVFGYFCETHGMPGAGMYGTINVLGGPPNEPAIDVPGGSVLFGSTLTGLLIALAAYQLKRARRATSQCRYPRNPK